MTHRCSFVAVGGLRHRKCQDAACSKLDIINFNSSLLDQSKLINNLIFADDTALVEKYFKNLQQLLDQVVDSQRFLE